MNANVLEIALPVFKGPLDLLLHLIEREELDITTVSLVQVTDQYLAAVRARETIDIAALAEFVAIGARLLYLKSRALLPRPPAVLEPEEEEDVGQDLVAMLEEYRRFKQVAEHFRERQHQGLRSYRRAAPPPQMPLPLGLDDVTLEVLIRLFREALDRRPEEEPVGVLERDPVTVPLKVDEILQALSGPGRIGFRSIVERCRRRVEVVVTFLAVLELIKAGRIAAAQDTIFGDIELVLLGPAPAATGPWDRLPEQAK